MKKEKSLGRLIPIGALDVVKDIYLNIFLIAKIYDLAVNATRTIAVYYIIEYLCIAATLLICSNFFKKNPVIALRIGIVINLILLIIIMRIDNEIITYYPFIACIFGIAMGTYYGPTQVLLGYYASKDSVNYCTISNILSNIVNIVFPISIGAYIETTSFVAVTFLMLIVSGMQLLLSTGIKNVQTIEKCNLVVFLKILKRDRMYNVIKTYTIIFLGGITSSVLDRTVLILIMMMFGSTMQLGVLSTIFAVFTVLSSYVVKRFYKTGASRMIKVSAIMPMLAVILLVIRTNVATFILYKAVSAVFICILTLLANTNRYNAIGDLTAQYAAEHQTLSELSLAAGRITGLLVLLFVNEVIGGLIAIKSMLLIIGVIIIAYSILIASVQKVQK